MLYLLTFAAYVVAVSSQGGAEIDPCTCTGDNSAIPQKQKKYAGTPYGTSCKNWDMTHRYCRNPKSLQEANRACWCPKKWCYVSKECETAKLSAFFKKAELYYSYDACGNSVDQCFDEDDDDVGEFDKALEEENEAGDEPQEPDDTLEDVVDAVVLLTIRVNEIAKVVNGLSKQVSALNGGVIEIAGEDGVTGILAPDEAGPVLLPTEQFAPEGFAQSYWGEMECPLGYKVIVGIDKCMAAGKAFGYQQLSNMGDGKGDKVCLYNQARNKDSPAGIYMAAMSKGVGESTAKLICQKRRND